MATYFMFGKYSTEAMRDISVERTEKTVQLIEEFGGSVKSMYALVGDKDLVFIVDLPGTEQAIKASVELAKVTGIAFSTSPAITVEDFDKLVT